MEKPQFQGTITIVVKGTGTHADRLGVIHLEADGLGAAEIETVDVTPEEIRAIGISLANFAGG